MVMDPLASSINKKEAQRISANWWLLFVVGLITTIAGIVIISIDWTILTLSIFVGILFMFKGLGLAFTPSLSGGSRGWNILLGLLGIAVGIAILSFPSFAAFTLVALALFAGIWLIVWGVAHSVVATSNRYLVSYWWLSLAIGIVSIVAGILVLFDPIISVQVAVFIIGIWAILSGVSEMALSFEVRTLPEEISMMEEVTTVKEERAA